MSQIGYFVAAERLDAFDSILINIKLSLSGNSLVMDLIPSVIGGDPVDPSDFDPEIRGLMKGCKPLSASNRFMRVRFRRVYALVVQEEFIEIIDDVKGTLNSAPRLPDGVAPYPFLRKENSELKRKLLDFQNDPAFQHYKILSLETIVDVIAIHEGNEWLTADSR